MVKDNNKFNFFVPATFEKGGKGGNIMRIKGIASSETEDSDGETLLPSGFDLSPLLEKGFLNYNHQSQKDPSAIIGEPTKAEIINNGKDLYIEGFLYPDSDEAVKTYTLAKVLEKNSPNRRMGFSIEGKALEKDPLNPLRITKARITGIALTACPKNANTLLSIMKGEYSEPFIESEEIEDIDTSILLQYYKDWSNGDSHFGNVDNVKEFLTSNHEDHLYKLEELHKAVTAASGEGVWQKESVSGGQDAFKNLIEEKENAILKKSEVYSLILSKYSDYIGDDIQKAKQIYQLIKEINTKRYSMENTTKGEVLSKALENTFSFIDEQINILEKGEKVDELIKSDADEKVEEKDKEEKKEETSEKDTDSKKEDEEDKDDEKENIKKSEDIVEVVKLDDVPETTKSEGYGADAFIKSLILDELKKGVSQEEISANLISKGLDSNFVSTTIASCVAEMSNLEANGDLSTEGLSPSVENVPVSTHSPLADSNPIAKSEDIDIIKSELVNEFESRQNVLVDSLESRFKALGNILKSQSEQNNTILENLKGLKEENTDLKKSLASANEKINTFAGQPQRSRTITSSNQIAERFQGDIQKSQNGKTQLSLSNKYDMSSLTDTLNTQYDIQKSQGADNRPLANALFELAVANTMDANTANSIRTDLNALNIELVK